jgi:hypothetical protein
MTNNTDLHSLDDLIQKKALNLPEVAAYDEAQTKARLERDAVAVLVRIAYDRYMVEVEFHARVKILAEVLEYDSTVIGAPLDHNTAQLVAIRALAVTDYIDTAIEKIKERLA